MSNKNTKNLWVRLTCLSLAGIMVLGVATTAIFLIVNILGADGKDKKDSLSVSYQAEFPVYDERWTV